MGWSTPRTWAVGEVVTAANMNQYVSQELAYLKGQAGPVTIEDQILSKFIRRGGSASSWSTSGSTIYNETGVFSIGGICDLSFSNSAIATTDIALGSDVFSGTDTAMVLAGMWTNLNICPSGKLLNRSTIRIEGTEARLQAITATYKAWWLAIGK